MSPDRVIVGADDDYTVGVMRRIYEPSSAPDRLMVMDVRSAELTKYAANAMLATRISFMNEMANLAETLGADVEQVRRGIGADPRIGYHFLYPGAGYGGSCFPRTCRRWSTPPPSTAAHARHRGRRGRQPRAEIPPVRADAALRRRPARRKIALWGLAFKPNTDDMREAPA